LELKPGHSNGQKELEQSGHAAALLEYAIARFDAEEFHEAAEALEKVLDVSSECAQVYFTPFPGFFLCYTAKVLLTDGQPRRLASSTIVP
jgi:hypothetical protein